MTKSRDQIAKMWLSPGSCSELWGSSGTYVEVPHELLPPLPGRGRDDLGWLKASPPSDSNIGATADEVISKRIESLKVSLEALRVQAGELNLVVPSSFVEFIQTPSLIERVPSCTACYVDLPSRLIDPPGGAPGKLLRFLNDQQCCALWYLHLREDGGHQVVWGYPEFREDDDSESLDDAIELGEISLCATSFDEFLHRFWLENTIWFAIQAKRTLTPDEKAYVDAAQKA